MEGGLSSGSSGAVAWCCVMGWEAGGVRGRFGPQGTLPVCLFGRWKEG